MVQLSDLPEKIANFDRVTSLKPRTFGCTISLKKGISLLTVELFCVIIELNFKV